MTHCIISAEKVKIFEKKDPLGSGGMKAHCLVEKCGEKSK